MSRRLPNQFDGGAGAARSTQQRLSALEKRPKNGPSVGESIGKDAISYGYTWDGWTPRWRGRQGGNNTSWDDYITAVPCNMGSDALDYWLATYRVAGPAFGQQQFPAGRWQITARAQFQLEWTISNSLYPGEGVSSAANRLYLDLYMGDSIAYPDLDPQTGLVKGTGPLANPDWDAEYWGEINPDLPQSSLEFSWAQSGQKRFFYDQWAADYNPRVFLYEHEADGVSSGNVYVEKRIDSLLDFQDATDLWLFADIGFGPTGSGYTDEQRIEWMDGVSAECLNYQVMGIRLGDPSDGPGVDKPFIQGGPAYSEYG